MYCSVDRQRKGRLWSFFWAALWPSMHIHASTVQAALSFDYSWAFPRHVTFVSFSSWICLGWCFVSANNFNNTFSFMWRNLTNSFAGLSPIFCIIYPGCITDTKKSLEFSGVRWVDFAFFGISWKVMHLQSPRYNMGNYQIF